MLHFLNVNKPECRCSYALIVYFKYSISPCSYVFAIDLEQVSFCFKKTNYSYALASKAFSKRTLTPDKVRGAILNAFLICLPLEWEDPLNKARSNCF